MIENIIIGVIAAIITYYLIRTSMKNSYDCSAYKTWNEHDKYL